MANSNLLDDLIEQRLVGFKSIDVNLQRCPANHVYGSEIEPYLISVANFDDVHATDAGFVWVSPLWVPGVHYRGVRLAQNLTGVDVS